MNGWLDWRAIEERNDWGLREKTDAMGEKWDESAAMWDRRWKAEEAFTKRQADAITDLRSDDVVLDIGCGTGPLTVNIAPRVRKVVAQDFGEAMLGMLRANLAERGISNVETLQGNWHTMTPGVDLPVCDVAITRWSPAQGNILKMSRCATRRCYSLSTCDPHFAEGGVTTGGYWCRSTVDEAQNRTPRPCGRKYGFNVHFNLLYDHGANPEIRYVTDEHEVSAPTREELLAKLRLPPGVPAPKVCRRPDGRWAFTRRMTIVVMSWDPSEVCYG